MYRVTFIKSPAGPRYFSIARLQFIVPPSGSGINREFKDHRRRCSAIIQPIRLPRPRSTSDPRARDISRSIPASRRAKIAKLPNDRRRISFYLMKALERSARSISTVPSSERNSRGKMLGSLAPSPPLPPTDCLSERRGKSVEFFRRNKAARRQIFEILMNPNGAPPAKRYSRPPFPRICELFGRAVFSKYSAVISVFG